MTRVVLVTGAAGGVGQVVLPALRRAGWTTRCLVHRREVDGADELVLGDLTSGAGLDEGARGATAVLHLAAATHARSRAAYNRVNVDGTRRLVRAALAAGVQRFLHVSTRAISPEGGGYSLSKLLAEQIVEAEARGRHVIVRLPELYGLGGNEGVDKILSSARRGAPILVVGAGADEICPVHVDDVVGPLVTALASVTADGTFTIAGECMSVREFAVSCAAAFGGQSRVVGVPVPLVRAASAVSRRLPLPLVPDQLARLRAPKPALSPSARAELGFDPQPLAVHLARLAAERP